MQDLELKPNPDQPPKEKESYVGLALFISVLPNVVVFAWAFCAVDHFYGDRWWISAANITLIATLITGWSLLGAVINYWLDKK